LSRCLSAMNVLKTSRCVLDHHIPGDNGILRSLHCMTIRRLSSDSIPLRFSFADHSIQEDHLSRNHHLHKASPASHCYVGFVQFVHSINSPLQQLSQLCDCQCPMGSQENFRHLSVGSTTSRIVFCVARYFNQLTMADDIQSRENENTVGASIGQSQEKISHTTRVFLLVGNRNLNKLTRKVNGRAVDGMRPISTTTNMTDAGYEHNIGTSPTF
jgi:hypothetical protein